MMIRIIGAGPIGSFAAYNLAKKGHNTTLYEEHAKIGLPIRCTGIVTNDINRLIRIKPSVITNKIHNIYVISPDNVSLQIRLKDPEIILNRDSFDAFLAEKAEKEGAKIITEARFLRRIGKKAIFRSKEGIEEGKFDALIGADGPDSTVAKDAGLMKRREYYIGMQARIKGNFEKDSYKAFLGADYPGFFAWIVPENEEIARAGIGARTHVNFVYENFMRKQFGKGYKKKVISQQGGLIPVFNPFNSINKRDAYIVGDAAGHVKATTGGGIIPGMKAAIALSESITNNTSYKKEFWKSAGKELMLHLMLRKSMDRFRDKDYNRFIRLASQQKIRDILETESRDNSIKLILRTLAKEPRFASFGKVIMKKKI